MSAIGWSTLDVIPSFKKGFGTALAAEAAPEMSVAGLASGKAFSKAALLGMSAIAVGGAAVVGTLFGAGKSFQDMTNTIRVGTGLTGKDLDSLVAQAVKLGTVVPASFGDIGTAIVGVRQRLDLAGNDLTLFTKDFLELGRVTKTALDMNTITGSLTAFRVTGAATVGGLNALYQVSQKTGVGVNELAMSLKTGAPVLEQYGFGFKDSAAFIGVLDKAGINAETTLMALKMGLINFAKAGRDPETALKATVAQIEALTKAGNSPEALKLAATIFSARGATQFVAAVQSGKINLDAMYASVHAGSDTIEKASVDTQHFSEKWQEFQSGFGTAIKPEADALFKVLTDGMGWMSTNGIGTLQNFGSALGADNGLIIKTTEVLGAMFIGWRALLIVESVSSVMLNFVRASKSSMGIMVLYRATMTALMDTQAASAVAQAATGAAAAEATAALAAETAVTAALTAGVSAATMSEYTYATATGTTTLSLREYLAATIGAEAATASLAATAATATAAEGTLAVSTGLIGRGMAMFSTAFDAAPLLTFAGAIIGIGTALDYLQGKFGTSAKNPATWVDKLDNLIFGKAFMDKFDSMLGMAAPTHPSKPAITIGGNPGSKDYSQALQQSTANDFVTKAAALAQAKLDKAAALRDAAIVKAEAAAKAAADIQAALQLKTATENQKKILSDFARWLGQDYLAAITDPSKKASDIIGSIMGNVNAAISGHTATISDKTKADTFTLGATKISNKLETDLFGYQSKLDGYNAQRTKLATDIANADTALKDAQSLRTNAIAGIQKLIASPLGTPSDLSKAFVGANTTVDTVLSGYDNLLKLVNDRFSKIDGPNKDNLVTFLQNQSKKLIGLVADRLKVVDELKTAQTALDKIVNTDKPAYADGISTGLKNASNSLTDFVSSVTLADGRITQMVASPAALIAAFAKRATAVKNFATNIQTLTSRGLGKGLTDQLLGMGADSGGALADALAKSTDAQLAALQDSSTQINSTADALGKSLSDKFYDQSIADAKSIVDGWQKSQDSIDAQMTSITTSITDKLAPLIDGTTIIGKDSAQALLDSLKSKDAELLGWAQAIGAKMAQALADALTALNVISGGNNFGPDVAAAKGAAAKLADDAAKAAAKAASDKAAQDAIDAKKAADAQTKSETDARNAADARAAAAVGQAQLDAINKLITVTSAQTTGVINKLRAMGVLD